MIIIYKFNKNFKFNINNTIIRKFSEIMKEKLAEDPKLEAFTVFKRFDRENKNL